MSAPVDLTDLREMTEGDEEMEKELFEEFFSSAEECITALEDNCVSGENESWRTNAHALKGTSINLGAATLGDLCKQAQDSHGADEGEKKALLESIRAEYALVKDYLSAIY